MKLLKISSIILLIIATSACKKALDLEPQSDISDFAFWKSANDYRLAANWFYNYSLDDPHYSGSYMNDNNSDIAFGAEVNTISSGRYVPPEQDSNWDDSYAAIRNANKLIEEGTASSIKNEVKAYLGEGYFFRAYNYFRLLDLYGGVPIIDKVLQPNDPLVFTERASREAVLDFILGDLNNAVSNLPVKASVEKGRICKEAAQALKARICLFEGTWRKFHGTGDGNGLLDQAITESKNVINSNAYTLNQMRGDSSYRMMFIDTYSMENPETIISKKYRTNINVNGWAYGVSWGNLNPTKAAADMYLCRDGLPIDKSPFFKGYDSTRTEFRFRDPRMTQSLIMPATKIVRPQYDKYRPQWPGIDNNRNVNSGYMLYKFISQMATPGDGGGAFDWNIIRYAEVLTIFAEATYERKGSISDAELDISINLLRDRVKMPHLTNAVVSANGLNMQTEIRRERTVELAFEGFRWDDLRRWKTAESLLTKSVLSVKVTGSEWSKQVISLDGESYNSYFYNTPAAQLENGFKVLQPASQRAFDVAKNYLLPIPTKQISLNPDKLKQNPGW
jgi:hypothetical protein